MFYLFYFKNIKKIEYEIGKNSYEKNEEEEKLSNNKWQIENRKKETNNDVK